MSRVSVCLPPGCAGLCLSAIILGISHHHFWEALCTLVREVPEVLVPRTSLWL